MAGEQLFGDLKLVDAQGDGTEEEQVAEQGSLIVDETRMSREQVLELAFTPRDLIRGRRVSEGIVKIGREENASLAPTSSFIARQIRQVYDANHFQRIGRSMRDDFGGQLQRGQVGLHSEESAERYLIDLNEHFETEYTLDDLAWHKKFAGFLITIAGHNRQLGAAFANVETNGHPDKGIPFQVRLFRDPLFWQALRIQAMENSGQNPHSWEKSREMWTIRRQGPKHGFLVTTEEIAGIFAVDPDQVTRSLRFEELPTEIKLLVRNDKLPFSGAFQLDRLLKLFEEADVIDLARKFAREELTAKDIENEVKKREVVKDLPVDIRLLVDADAVKYSHAEVLADMRRKGVDEEIILEMATKAALEHPPIQQFRAEADNYISDAIKGARSLLVGKNGEGEEGLSPEELDAARKDHIDRSTRAKMANRSRDVMEGIAGMASIMRLGMAGTGVEHRPISGQISDVLLVELDKVIELARAEGDEDAASQVEKRREALASLRKRTPESEAIAMF